MDPRNFWMLMLKRLALVAVVLIALPFILEPPVLRYWHTEKPGLELEPFEPSDEAPLDWRLAAYFDDTVAAELAPAGFERVRLFRLPALREFRRYGAIYRSPTRPELVMATALLDRGRSVLAARRVSFTTVLEDGRIVETDNESRPEIELEGDHYWYLPLPRVRGVARLHQAHCSFVRHVGVGDQVARVPEGGELDELRREIELQFASQLDSGLWVEDEAENENGVMETVHRPTWRGAFELSWGRAWPIGAMRRSARLREADAILEQLPSAEELEEACPPVDVSELPAAPSSDGGVEVAEDAVRLVAPGA